ncbi:MAG: hypothetical protein WBN40_02585 [Pseudomonadales bacterium]
MAVINYLRPVKSRVKRDSATAIARLLAVIVGLAASQAYAAIVSVSTPAGPGMSTYDVGGQTYSVFSNITDSTAPFGSNFGGEELIWLGAHGATPQGIIGDAPGALPGTIAVNLNNIGSGTGQVSLVLSSEEIVSWDILVGANVQLNNIFIISLASTLQETHQVIVETETLGSDSAGLAPAQSESVSGVNVKRSGTSTFAGYEYAGLGQACDYLDPAPVCETQRALGLAPLFEGQPANEWVNQLAEVQDDPDPLKLTSFNGSYYVSQFDVDLVGQVIPIPAAAWLFASAIAWLGAGRALFSRRNGYRRRLHRQRIAARLQEKEVSAR